MPRPTWLLLFLASCASTPLPFGMDAPGTTPELFAPGVVSTDGSIELNGVLAPDGRELFFTRVDRDGRFVMHRTRLVAGRWTEPEAVEAFAGGAGDTAVDMSVSADGNELVFLGRAPGGVGDPPGLDLWRMRREGDTWVSPDERVLVVASRRPGGRGAADLWISTRTEEGGWTEPRNLGPGINTEGYEYCPMGTWDGRLFFFSRRIGRTWEEATGVSVYWVDAAALGVSR